MDHLFKRLVRFAAIISVLILSVFAIDATSRQSALDTSNSERAYFEERGELQRRATEAYDILYNSFLISGTTKESYPENYGGSYIDDSILHILIVDLPTQTTTHYTEMLSDYQDVVTFENAVYPLQMLYDCVDDVAQAMMDDGIFVSCYGADIKGNCAYVGVDTEASGIEQIENISQCYNSSRDERSIPISFIEEEHVSTATELIGGSPLYGYTVGVCGTYEGSEAIGLCGHGLSKYSSIETPERTTIGYVSVAVFNNNGSGDYGIAKISNVSFTTAGLVGDPSDRPWEVTGASNRPVTGVDIVKYGKNSGLDYGYVTDNNATWIFYDDNNNKFTIRNVVQAKLQSGEVIKGDSGGPVFSPNGVIYGTISSTSNSSRSFYFSPFVYLFDRGFTVKKYG